ncbi:MAG: hypothetical protein V3T43_02780 [Nitrosomonadaceae bacterium]
MSRWSNNLSPRAVNVLFCAYTRDHTGQYNPHRDLEKFNIEIYSEKYAKGRVKNDIKRGNLHLNRLNNCGKVTKKELLDWCGLGEQPLSYAQLVRENKRLKALLGAQNEEAR